VGIKSGEIRYGVAQRCVLRLAPAKMLDGADVIDCMTPRCFGHRFFAEAVATELKACSDRMNGAPT
jgi:hypothetical protein